MLLATLLMLASFEPPPEPPSAPAEIVVLRSAAKPAIQRILRADNLDVERLPPRQVADRMEAIPQGAAPRDFWLAYQAHVRAWRAYADATDRSRSANPLKIDTAPDGHGIAVARKLINTTFNDVERVAAHYGVKPPLTSAHH